MEVVPDTARQKFAMAIIVCFQSQESKPYCIVSLTFHENDPEQGLSSIQRKNPLWEEIPRPRPGNREHQLQELVFTMSDAWSASPGQGTVCTPVRSTGYRLNVYITQIYSSM
jgi:hypothetical protein